MAVAMLFLLLIAASVGVTVTLGTPRVVLFVGFEPHQADDLLLLGHHLHSSGLCDVEAVMPEDRAAAELATPGHLVVHTYASMSWDPPATGVSESPIQALTSRLGFQLANCASLLGNKTIIKRLGRPSLLLGAAADPCAKLLADQLDVPLVAVDDGSAGSVVWGAMMHLGTATSHVATYGTELGGGAGMRLFDLVRNAAAYYRLAAWHALTYRPRIAEFRKRHRLARPGSSSSRSCVREHGHLTLTTADWGFLEPRALPPTVKVVGPLQPRPAQPLPEELAAFVEEAPHGVTVIRLPPEYRLTSRALMAIAESILDLKQRVVWEIKDNDFQRLLQVYRPLQHVRHVYNATRVPLQDLLGHPKTVSLITDGSVQSIYLAIYHAKPIIAVPMDHVQRDAVARVVHLGIGQRLDKQELDGGAAPYRLSMAIERMSNVYGYTDKVQRLSTRLHAAQGTALERAAFWVQYVLSLGDSAAAQLHVGELLPASACMGTLAAANVAGHAVLAAAAAMSLGLAVLAIHVCTRVPVVAPGKRKLVKVD